MCFVFARSSHRFRPLHRIWPSTNSYIINYLAANNNGIIFRNAGIMHLVPSSQLLMVVILHRVQECATHDVITRVSVECYEHCSIGNAPKDLLALYTTNWTVYFCIRALISLFNILPFSFNHRFLQFECLVLEIRLSQSWKESITVSSHTDQTRIYMIQLWTFPMSCVCFQG
jgi:hypothetical protein